MANPVEVVNVEHLLIQNTPTTITKNTYTVHFHEHFDENKNYSKLIDLLISSSEEDKFIFWMNNRGGQVSSGMNIIYAMQQTASSIICYVTGHCYSLAPLVALSAHQLVISDEAMFMFHDYSGQSYGKGNEMYKHVLHSKPAYDTFIKKVTNGFLSPDEQKALINGEDKYYHASEIKKRLKKIDKLLEF